MASRSELIARLVASWSSQAQQAYAASVLLTHVPSTSPTFLPPKSTSEPRNVLVLDSSFNPPTQAHLSLVELSLKSSRQNFDLAVFSFSTANADKTFQQSALSTRLLAISHLADTFSSRNPTIPTQSLLISQPYFLDKSKALHTYFESTYGRDVPFHLYFILGYDTLIRFFDPKYYTTVDMEAEMSRFFARDWIICANRVMSPASSGVSVDSVDEQEKKLAQFMTESPAASLLNKFKDKILFLPEWLNSSVASISSTLARTVLKDYWAAKKEGRDVGELAARLQELIPESILEMISREQLYKE
ncbi:hypothetical protein HDV00_009971 [Rhizophlyctis rosea]|nr:hypothetical protein HDV00_009971 [Rhizophlyctis rosea]